MFIVSWVFDKLGYMPKVSIDANWPFPATQKDYTPHSEEVKPKKAVKKAVKIPKATTRKTTKK
jgi:hypothetical protein